MGKVQAAQNYEQHYQGTWVSERYKISGDFDVFINITKNKVSGNIEISGSPTIKRAAIEGQLEQGKITFGIIDDSQIKLTYEGTLQDNKMSGRYYAKSPYLKDSGSWDSVKIDKPRPPITSTRTRTKAKEGYKCVQTNTKMTYYFKNNNIRFEPANTVSGLTTYDIQLGNTKYYKIVEARGNAHVSLLRVTRTYDEWFNTIVDKAKQLKGKTGANMAGAPHCQTLELSDDLFSVPKQ